MKTMKNLSWDSLIPSGDLNPEPTENKTEEVDEHNALLFLPLFTGLTIRGNLSHMRQYAFLRYLQFQMINVDDHSTSSILPLHESVRCYIVS